MFLSTHVRFLKLGWRANWSMVVLATFSRFLQMTVQSFPAFCTFFFCCYRDDAATHSSHKRLAANAWSCFVCAHNFPFCINTVYGRDSSSSSFARCSWLLCCDCTMHTKHLILFHYAMICEPCHSCKTLIFFHNIMQSNGFCPKSHTHTQMIRNILVHCARCRVHCLLCMHIKMNVLIWIYIWKYYHRLPTNNYRYALSLFSLLLLLHISDVNAIFRHLNIANIIPV